MSTQEKAPKGRDSTPAEKEQNQAISRERIGEDPARFAPGLTPDELLAALQEVCPPKKEALGAIALELTPPDEAQETDEF